MRLLPNWRAVLRKAWSVRLMALAVILSGLEAVAWLAPELLPIKGGWLALVACFASIGSMVARVFAQKELQRESTSDAKGA